MKVTKEVIQHVANLARLNLSENDKTRLTRDMEEILGYVDKLNELDTEGIKPREHVKPVSNVFREDIEMESYDREDILRNAPAVENGCFKVPKIVE